MLPFFIALLCRLRAEDPNPLLSPKEALKRFSLPPGFTADILKAEPDLVQPIAFCWDEHGRLWVVEGNTYPQRAGKPPVPRPDEDPHLDRLNTEELASVLGGSDRIVIFSDEDGDGSFETKRVFLENLNLVSGIEMGFGGVYVGAAPYLLHIPLDASGTQPSGPPRVLADGFGWHDTHETLNSFIWGPDGWLYGCHGVFTHSQVRVCTGPAGTRKRTPMNCAYWRWHPVREEFEIFAQGTSNPWGLDFNSRGQFFAEACVIPHFWHIIQGAYYLRQSNPMGHFNPYVYKNIETIADHAHFVGKQSAKDPSDDAGGGHAHCGLCIYEGENFPPEYRGAPSLETSTENESIRKISCQRALDTGRPTSLIFSNPTISTSLPSRSKPPRTGVLFSATGTIGKNVTLENPKFGTVQTAAFIASVTKAGNLGKNPPDCGSLTQPLSCNVPPTAG